MIHIEINVLDKVLPGKAPPTIGRTQQAINITAINDNLPVNKTFYNYTDQNSKEGNKKYSLMINRASDKRIEESPIKLLFSFVKVSSQRELRNMSKLVKKRGDTGGDYEGFTNYGIKILKKNKQSVEQEDCIHGLQSNITQSEIISNIPQLPKIKGQKFSSDIYCVNQQVIQEGKDRANV
jgi:hypothetical protein